MNKEIIIPVLVSLLALAFVDPLMVLMPSSLPYILVTALFIATLSYSLLIWKENAQDEREDMHRAFSGRVAYIVGVCTLVLSIIYQVLVVHDVDILLVSVLISMTFAKYFAHKFISEEQ